MAGQLPPISTSAPPPPPKPDGFFIRLWNAFFPGGQIPKQPTADESAWFQMIFRPWSLPFRIAVFVAVVLFAIVTFCLWEFSTNPYHVPWRYSLTNFRVALICLFLLVIPLSVYHALKLWLNVEKSAFPDINAAWQAGVEALRKQGVTVGDKPIFLVIGSADEQQERIMFESSNSAFIVSGVPEGPAPMHWYANADRIFLSCTGVGWLTALSALISRQKKVGGVSTNSENFGGAASSDPKFQNAYSTLNESQSHNDAPVKQATAPPKGKEALKTISYWAMEEDENPTPESPRLPSISSTNQEQPLAIIQPSDAAEQEDRLEAVCDLLRAARYPYSPINGCITLIPFAAARIEMQEVEEMAKAINGDLQTLYKTLRVRYPVTAIFTGMEAEPGFRELMRRVGPDRCAANRFGMGYDLRSPASSSEIGTFAAHVCGVFEDWVYGLFREDQALKRPGNASLFTLLCRVRSNFKDRLTILLSQGFGYSDRLDPDAIAFLFSGCYFVASGTSNDKRAFIQGISEKLDGQQDQLEWSQEAIRSARNLRRLTTFALTMIGVLTILLGYMIIAHPLWSR